MRIWRRGVMQRIVASALSGTVALTAGISLAKAEGALPVGALTPLWRIGVVVDESGLDPTLQTGPFDPNAPRPVNVAVVPPSVLNPAMAAESASDGDPDKLARLQIPEIEEAPAVIRPRRKPPVPPRVVTADARTQPPIAGSDAMALKAASYRRFIDDVYQVAKLRLDKPRNINRATKILMAHDPKGISHGLVAQGGTIAVGSKPFKSGLEAVAKRRGGPDAFIKSLRNTPNDVHGIKGAEAAQQDILKSVATDIAVMRSLSYRLIEVAYERSGNEPRLSAEAGNGGLTLASLQSSGMAPNIPSRTGSHGWPIVTQMLQVGAHMGIEGAAELADIALMKNKKNDQCLKWAKLNLDQCIAAARLTSEKAFCLSKHALDERAECFGVTLK